MVRNKNLLWLSFLILFLAIFNGYLFNHKNNSTRSATADLNNRNLSLLLNSGLIDNCDAEIKYLIWTEDSGELPQLEKKLKDMNLEWKKQVLTDFSQNRAYKYIAVMNINSSQGERKALQNYWALTDALAQQKVKVYLEERVNSHLDPEQFFKKNTLFAQEKIYFPGGISYSGWKPDYLNFRPGGFELLTVQLIVKKNPLEGGEKAVLALPALLEEF
ncbi:MAG: hypothetical protein ACOX7U_05055 [Desulfitobacteriia bacterium]|jgi:hypothetical protein